MISLDHLLLDEAVLTASFSCDLASCKGACCTLPGGSGAPLLDSEVEDLRASVEAAWPYLSERSRAQLKAEGPLEGFAGSYEVGVIDNKDCVFVRYEGDVATCAIERAWHNGESTFRKPLSCHLFPIRVAQFGGPYLHYEVFEECEPGRERGAKLRMPLIESLKDALVRAYGIELYERMAALARGEDNGEDQ
jgi:hypothetical protein